MATWIQCSTYNQEKTPMWVNLDLVICIRENIKGSTLFCSAQQGVEPYEIAVWDTPHEILAKKSMR